MSSNESLTPLSIAFIWHMHQPEYKDLLSGEYLMPWVRLHAIKDYLDMVMILEDYPKIRQTFNLVPSLIDQLEDYCKPDTCDRYMKITLQEYLSEEDKLFILQRFFDAPKDTMIARSPYYYFLSERRNRFLEEGYDNTAVFPDQEYHDITALFNLVWFDPIWMDSISELRQLWQKQRGYTLAERERIIEIQREIIQKILPTYKTMQDKGHIEITTTPYYHPILPLLIDSDSAHVSMPHAILPEEPFQYSEDASYHVSSAIERYKELFGYAPHGVWPSEQAISPDTIRLLKQHGFKWGVSSEGILSRSLGVGFEKDPYGNILNADILCQPYHFEGVNLIFRHLTLSDLIGFSYASISPDEAANDFIHRLKQIQQQCTNAGLKHPVVTIALDGENCWEFFPEDGHIFLKTLYTALSEDETLNVCTVRDYFDNIQPESIRKLEHLHSGSWINSDFHIWIGEPLKNAAWMYLNKTRSDLKHLSDTGHYQPEILKKAWQEIYIAEGSDWFWWYGEPNNSGQDELFDMQFRRHLSNVYHLMDLPIPDFLKIPLTVTMGRPLVMPSSPISPRITGFAENHKEWLGAGYFDMTHGAMHRSSRILNKIHFGCDDTSFYIRFDLNKNVITAHHEIYLYFCAPGKTRHNSPVRVKSASGKTVPAQRYHYAYEIRLSQLFPGKIATASAESLPDHIWYNRQDIIKDVAYDDILEMAISYDSMNIHAGEYVQFVVALVQGDIVEEMHPSTYLLHVKRCEQHEYSVFKAGKAFP